MSCKNIQNLSDAKCLLVMTVFAFVVLAENLVLKLFAVQ